MFIWSDEACYAAPLCPKQTLEIILEFYVSQCTVSFILWNIQMILGKFLHEFGPLYHAPIWYHP
jgi:hypothetical protein